MKEKLTNNIPLKIGSLIAAFLVWLIVVNIDDPTISKTLSGVSVQVQNEAYIESSGRMCLIEEGNDVASVTITGKRSIVDKVEASDITATADLKQIVDMDTTPIMVPITVSCPGISSTSIQSTPRNMSISIEEIMSQDFVITASAGDTKPGKSYEIGDLTCSPEKVTITGPQSIIKKIEKVVASIDVTDIEKDTTKSVSLKIIDKNQDELSDSQIQYLKYDITDPVVDVTATLWNVKSDVEIDGGYVGTPEDGYKVDKITFTPQKISVAGSTDGLAEITASGNTIMVPDDAIDVSGLDSDTEVKIDIEKLLPDDVKLTTDTSSTVIAKVAILPLDSKDFTIPTTSITTNNIPSGLEAVYETEKITVRVRESASSTKNIDTLDTGSIKASIDLADKGEGSYTVPVKISLPEGYELVSEVTTSVKLASTTQQSK